ncbi:MAG: cysteine hydrolase [Clostridiales bacterium]|nr:cysteine hydrolase [Clostridiales bacterium]MDY4060113.1 isochorismatase family cysteine hydrolase [Anaerovoracaceae bacterium]
MCGKKVFIVIDMQNDFITGPLGNKECQSIVETLKAEIEKKEAEGYEILFTKDTHGKDYLETQEGKNLPIPHCIEGSKGWEIIPELAEYARGENVLCKGSFGDVNIGNFVERAAGGVPEEIIITGVCTDICVISNSIILKAFFPETPIKVIGNLCAGVSPEGHRRALEAMGPCQINVI